jgi:spermidine synthase
VNRRGGRALTAVAGLLFLSGATALVYQVLWQRLLGLVFGVTVYAASAVLASFMAGLALGSVAGGSLADRWRRPLLGYGVAEVLVGLSAIASPWALDRVEALYLALHPRLAGSFGVLTAVRVLLSFLVLLVPTTLMGATFPLVVRSPRLAGRTLGARIGILYAANTAGGIAGTLVAGLYLIGAVGIAASFRLAAAVNLGVGLAAAALSRRWEGAGAAREERVESPAEPAPEAALGGGERTLVRAVFAVSGFASLGLEVVWFRVLSLFLQTTTYAFTAMLATVLSGIALGSVVATRLMRRPRQGLALLALLEIGTALACALSLPAVDGGFAVLGWAQALLSGAAARRGALALVLSFVVLVPATVLLGIAFPVGLRLVAGGRQEREGRRVGQFYALNVFGSIAGAVLAGFVLLPRWGSRASVLLLAGAFLASGLALLVPLVRSRPRFALAAAAAGAAAFAALAAFAPDPFDVALARRHTGARTLFHREGVQATVSVLATPEGRRVLYLDGLHQANDAPGVVGIHREIAALGLALHPAPQRALVIGLGGGVTAGSLSRDGRLAVQVVELSRAVASAAPLFRHVNDDVLQRRNVGLRIDDGRNFLLVTRQRYDILTADIIQPHHAGAGNLYSIEYFRLARQALADGGIMVQWVSPRSAVHYKAILRTFLAVFPEATLWSDGTLVVGGQRAVLPDPDAFARRMAEPGARAALTSLGIGSMPDLSHRYLADAPSLRAFVGQGPILTDDQPRVEFYLSLPRNDRPVDLSGLTRR